MVKSPKVAPGHHTRAADCQSSIYFVVYGLTQHLNFSYNLDLSIKYTTVVYGLAQFNFEFLFDCLEELYDVYAGEQPAKELRLVLVDFLSVSPPIVASSKSVRARPGFKCCLSPKENPYFKTAASKGSGGVEPAGKKPQSF